MTQRTAWALCLIFGGASLLSCGGAPAQHTSPSEAEPSPAEDPARANVHELAEQPKFSDMKPGQKMEFMKNTVTPHMKSVFQEFDAKAFENFSCKSCHGKRAGQGDFRMPSEDLPPLDASDGFADEQKAHPEMMQFMKERVVPEMAKLFGEAPYDPATQQGFGCFECHTKAH